LGEIFYCLKGPKGKTGEEAYQKGSSFKRSKSSLKEQWREASEAGAKDATPLDRSK